MVGVILRELASMLIGIGGIKTSMLKTMINLLPLGELLRIGCKITLMPYYGNMLLWERGSSLNLLDGFHLVPIL